MINSDSGSACGLEAVLKQRLKNEVSAIEKDTAGLWQRQRSWREGELLCPAADLAAHGKRLQA